MSMPQSAIDAIVIGIARAGLSGDLEDWVLMDLLSLVRRNRTQPAFPAFPLVLFELYSVLCSLWMIINIDPCLASSAAGTERADLAQ